MEDNGIFARVGDWVRCNTDAYSSLRKGQERQVLDVRIADNGSTLLVLRNVRSPYMGADGLATSTYLAHNFTVVRRRKPHKETPPMAPSRIKYFAVKLDPDQQEHDIGLVLRYPSADHVEAGAYTTAPRDTQHQARCDVSPIIKEGERWLIVQTVCMLEGEAPRPPVKVTEYR